MRGGGEGLMERRKDGKLVHVCKYIVSVEVWVFFMLVELGGGLS